MEDYDNWVAIQQNIDEQAILERHLGENNLLVGIYLDQLDEIAALL